MKRPSDLNEPGTKITAVIGVFLAVIPAMLYGSSVLLTLINIQLDIIDMLIKVSIVIGAAPSIILLMLIVVEQIQDYRYDVDYRRNQGRKLKLSGDYYECQYCGSQKVREADHYCRG